MKKIFALIICCAIALPFVPIETVTAAGTADDIISIAEGELGYRETGTNHVKYWDDLGASNMQGQSWCAAFIVWCARRCGIGSDIIPTSYSCYDASNSMKNWFEARGRYYTRGSTTPQRGDLVIFKYSSGGKHIGIVTGVSGDRVYTIEGNSSDQVKNNSYALTYSSIHGYCRPEYAAPAPPGYFIDDPVNYGNDFYAFIKNTALEKYVTNDGDNVSLRIESSSDNQKWHFLRQNDGSYKIVSLKDSRCLDVESALPDSGTNVKVYDDNGSIAQRWYIVREKLNQDERQYLVPQCSNCCLDVTGGSTADGTNLQIFTKNETVSQKFDIIITANGNGPQDLGNNFYAKIKNTQCGKILVNDEDDNVRLYSDSLSEPLRGIWHFEKTNGHYKITSAFDEKSLDVDNALPDNGVNVKTHPCNGNWAQVWYILGHEKEYALQSGSGATVVDFEMGHTDDGTNVWMWEWNDTPAQKYDIEIIGVNGERPINIGNDFYAKIKSSKCDKILVNDEDNNVRLYSDSLSEPLRGIWHFEKINEHYNITSAFDGKALDVANGLPGNGINVQAYQYNGSWAQSWYILGHEKEYTLQSGCALTVLDFEMGYTDDGTNVWMWEWNDTPAQKYDIEKISVLPNGSTPTATPSPASSPTAIPTATPTAIPTPLPTPSATSSPTASPTALPTTTPSPTLTPTAIPAPLKTPTPSATPSPTALPTALPTATPPAIPTPLPTLIPTSIPTPTTTTTPTAGPTTTPLINPSDDPEYVTRILTLTDESVDVSVSNISGSGAKLIVVSYTNDNVLVDIKSANIKTTLGETDNIRLNLNLKNASYIKVFVWNNLDTIKPLSECVENIYN